MAGDLEHVAEKLAAIAEELAELAIDRLRAALADGGSAEDERRITRARRAVEKAVVLLQPPGDPDGF